MKIGSKSIVLKGVFLSKWHPFIWIVIVVFIIYAQVLSFGYTYLDDNVLIIQNYPFIRSLSAIVDAFKGDVFHQTFGGSYYRPLLTLSFIIDAQLGGDSPFVYHLTNIILHAASSCLVFLLLKKLKYKIEISFFFALVFGVHPVLVQAVAWIPGRNNSLLGIFLLSGFIFFLNFIQTKRYKWLVGHLVSFALSLFTKESAAVFPLI